MILTFNLSVIHCPPLTGIVSHNISTIDSYNTSYRTTTHISCYPGFTIDNNASVTVTCNKDGRWYPHITDCKRK